RNEDALMVKNPVHLTNTKEMITNDFIVQSLSAQWARKKGLLVKAEDLNGEIDRVKKSYPDDLSFRNAVAEQGITFKDWKTRMEQSMIQKLIVEHLSTEIPAPSSSEIQSYYNKNREQFTR